MIPRLLIAAVAVAAITLSGCTALTGYPEGTIRVGDVVSIQISAKTPDGTVVVQPTTARFVVGSGASGLGMDLERSLQGRAATDAYNLTVRDDDSLGYREARLSKEIFDENVTGEITRSAFERYFGPAVLGAKHRILLYNATLTAVTTGYVNYTFTLQGTQVDTLADFGAYVVSERDGNVLRRHFEPKLDATFTVGEDSQALDFGLQPGQYVTKGGTAHDVVYDFSPARSLALVDQAVVYAVKVLTVSHGQVVTPVDGDYAMRRSPVVNGDPTTVRGLEPVATEHTH